MIDKITKREIEKFEIPMDETARQLKSISKEEDEKIAKLFGRRPRI